MTDVFDHDVGPGSCSLLKAGEELGKMAASQHSYGPAFSGCSEDAAVDQVTNGEALQTYFGRQDESSKQ